MGPFDKAEKFLAERMKSLAGKWAGGTPPATLVEIRRDILEDVRAHIQPKGWNEQVFPFDSIAVRLLAADDTQRGLFESAFLEDESLERDIRDYLTQCGAGVRGLNVAVSALTAPDEARAFEVLYSKGAARSARAGRRPKLTLRVVEGAAAAQEFSFEQDRINLGRLRDVRSESGGVLRRNDVAFDESETSVAREHAYIRFDSKSGRYRLCDYLSGDRGTRLFREGRAIGVPRASDSGAQLRSGDEFWLGAARIAVEIADE
jgi:hypothetical protein